MCLSNLYSYVHVNVMVTNSEEWFESAGLCYNGCIHNHKSDRCRFVRRDQSSPMKKNAFVGFITVMHTITFKSLYPIIPDWTFGIGYWNAYVTCHGHSFQKSCHEVRFFSDVSEQIWIWLWTRSISLGLIGSIGFLIMNATSVWTWRPWQEIQIIWGMLKAKIHYTGFPLSSP